MNLHFFKRYNKFIQAIITRNTKPNKGEVHHIIPRCMNGSNDKNNLIKLTYREHFIAHYLLYKAYPENYKLRFAFYQMCNKNIKTYKKDSYRFFVNSKSYEKLKELCIIKLSELQRDKVYVKNANGSIVVLSKEEYKNSDYKFHTTGKVYCYDLDKNEYVYIDSVTYQQNKHKYEIRRNFNVNQRSILVTNGEMEFYTTIEQLRDLKQENKNIKGMCYFDKEIKKEKVRVIDTESNNTKQIFITTEEYKNNPDRYLTNCKGKVVAINKITNKKCLVSKEEFKNNKHLYDGHTIGMTSVYDTVTMQYTQVSKEEFENNKERYKGPMYGKVSVVNKQTGLRETILKSNYNDSLYSSTGKLNLLIKCRNKINNKEKLFNIYEIIKTDVLNKWEITDEDKYKRALTLC